ncbi:MAG: ABC transporter ATP-binding protein [Chloroflexota bacterium]
MFSGGTGGGWWSYLRYDEENDRPTVNRELLLRVAGYGRPYWFKTTGLLGTIVIITLLSLIPPLLYRDLIDNALPNGDMTRLNWLALGMIGLPILSGIIGVGQRYLSSDIGESLIKDLRNTLFAHMQKMSLRFFTNAKTGELMSRLNNDVVGAQSALTGTFITIISNTITLIGTLTIMITLEWRLTLVGIAVLPLFVAPARRVGRILRSIRRESMEYNAEMNGMMNETLNVSGALLVKLFGRQATEVEKFHDRSGKVRDIGVRSAIVGRWFFMGLSLVSAVGTAVVFWLGGYLVLNGVFTIGTIVAFGAYLTQLYGPLMAMTNARVEFAQSMVSFERVFEVLDLPIEIEDKPDAITPSDLQGRVEIENVTFSYSTGGDGGAAALGVTSRRPGTDTGVAPAIVSSRQQTLTDISFSVEPGRIAALVGPSGSGKTTITYLLPRLYDPDEGRITLDGHDLRDLAQKFLSDHIGMVTQETYLFHDTIEANLLYAKPDATQAEIEAACQAANIHDHIVSLPDGYQTIVGERGYRLSGGEKQRISIARIILKDPKILILDEATSSLDSRSEALIQEALERIMVNRTTIVIAHRLSTILSADTILVLEDGKLVEQGTHEDLLAEQGLYANLYQTQFQPWPSEDALEEKPAAIENILVSS